MSRDVLYSQTSQMDEHLKLAISFARESLGGIRGRQATAEEIEEYIALRLAKLRPRQDLIAAER